MHKGRLEAFSDAVIAIVLTIMVLELRPPEGVEIEALRPLAPVFGSYLLSFVFLGIYWNNHHHMLQSAKHVNGAVLWANMHLLLWLSMVPFVTAWMGEHPTSAVPVATYGVVMLLSGIAYYTLARTLVGAHGTDSELAAALGNDFKGKVSVTLYVLAVPLALAWPLIAQLVYVFVALMWLVPDRRFEQKA